MADENELFFLAREKGAVAKLSKRRADRVVGTVQALGRLVGELNDPNGERVRRKRAISRLIEMGYSPGQLD